MLENYKMDFALQFQKVRALSACLELWHLRLNKHSEMGDVSVARYGVLAGEGKTGNVGMSLKLLWVQSLKF